MKKLCIALSTIACSLLSSVHAHGFATYEFFGELLYLQPNGSDLCYAAEALPFNNAYAQPAISPNWKIYEIDPNYHAAFDIGTKVIFHDSDVFLSTDWERMHGEDKTSHRVPPDAAAGEPNMIGPMFDIGPNSAAYFRAHGKAIFHFDQVNLNFGKSAVFIKRLHADFFTGLSFARIKQNLTSLFTNDSGGTSRKVKTVSTFTGGGPQMGVDFDYQICKHFSLTGATSATLLVGAQRNRTTFSSTSPRVTAEGPSPNVQTTSVPRRTQLIPGFEERIGLAFDGMVKSCKVTFGIGYEVQIYINAVQTVDMTAPQVEPSLTPAIVPDAGVFAVGFERTLSNFILSGPYARLTFDF